MNDVTMAGNKNQEIQKTPERHRISPPREALQINPKTHLVLQEDLKKYTNPEATDNRRTKELATDQSIAARNLLYHPSEASLEVIGLCADGVNSVMEGLKPLVSHDAHASVKKNEILVSMLTRLMADGGTGRIDGFNDQLKELVELEKKDPRPNDYAEKLHSLANKCRDNMAKITKSAKKEGPEGAVARQAIMSFMGDLGGLERHETGFGPAYKGPLGAPKDKSQASLGVYDAYVKGLCNHQRKLNRENSKASANDVTAFKDHFIDARLHTSEKHKNGVISAPAHTGAKKKERGVAGDFDLLERHGLLNQGQEAEEKFKSINPQHKTSLLNASWPKFVVSNDVTRDVVEPVTGHVSGTFGEAAFTMNMFCGTPPEAVTKDKPMGNTTGERAASIGALVAAGLITAGFHSAVEIFQPMSTFTTETTLGGMGPAAVKKTIAHEEALEAYGAELMKGEKKPKGFEYNGYKLTQEELELNIDDLTSKSESLAESATKQVDMISMLQGNGGTLATLEVSRVMANQSSNPEVVYKLYSVNTKLDELALRGSSPELRRAQKIAQLPKSRKQEEALVKAVEAAELAAESQELLDRWNKVYEDTSQSITTAINQMFFTKPAQKTNGAMEAFNPKP